MAFQTYVLCGFHWKCFVLQFWFHLLTTAASLISSWWTGWTALGSFQDTRCVVSATAPVNWLTCHHKLRYSYYSAFLFAVSNSMCMFLQSDPCDRDASARGTVSRTCRGVPRSSVTCRLCKIYLQCKKSMRRGFYTLVLSFIQQQRLQEAPELINYQLLKAMCTGIA